MLKTFQTFWRVVFLCFSVTNHGRFVKYHFENYKPPVWKKYEIICSDFTAY